MTHEYERYSVTDKEIDAVVEQGLDKMMEEA